MESLAAAPRFDRRVVLPECRMSPSAAFRLDASSSVKLDAAPVVLIVDDDPAARESLEMQLGSAGWRTESFACAMEFLARLRTAGPACLVLDVSLPDINGLDLLQRLADQGSLLPVIMVSAHNDVPTTVRAMKGGAIDFITKPFEEAVVLAAVALGIERSRAALQKESEMRVLQDRYTALTRREQEVMQRVVVGRLNKQVAWELDISEITVKAHRGKVMREMKIRSLPDLVKIAAKLGIGA